MVHRTNLWLQLINIPSLFVLLCSIHCFSCDESHPLTSQTSDLQMSEVEDMSIHSKPLDEEVNTAQNEFDTALEENYPRDEQIRFNHLQALGTHNSYHLEPELNILPWRYSHLPLRDQLDLQGVRQFELDIYEMSPNELEVFHVERLDDQSTCPSLTHCLAELKTWSDEHLEHHPLVVMIEPKQLLGPPSASIQLLEDIITNVWPIERILTPHLVQREYSSLAEGLEQEGWPTLSEIRGRIMIILHSGGALREAYLDAPGGIKTRVMFPDAYGQLDLPYAAFHSMNDPINQFDQIQNIVQRGHLVRTRTDADNVEPSMLDYGRSQKALDSGAHFLSTDFPVPPTDNQYGFIIPLGTPSRCNALTAIVHCESTDLEHIRY